MTVNEQGAAFSREEPAHTPASVSTPVPAPVPAAARLLDAALWGTAAAGVWLGAESGADFAPQLLRTWEFGAALLLLIGWCGLSAVGQAGSVLSVLAAGVVSGLAAGDAFSTLKSLPGEEILSHLPELLPFMLLLPLAVWLSGVSIRNAARIYARLRGRDAPNLKLYLLRLFAAEAVYAVLFAAVYFLAR